MKPQISPSKVSNMEAHEVGAERHDDDRIERFTKCTIAPRDPQGLWMESTSSIEIDRVISLERQTNGGKCPSIQICRSSLNQPISSER